MPVESLTAEDAVLLYAEAPGTQLQIGALVLLRGGAAARPTRAAPACSAAVPRGGPTRQRCPGSASGSLRCSGIWPRPCGSTTPISTSNVTTSGWCSRSRAGRTRSGSSWTACSSEPMDLAHPLWDIHVVEGVDNRIVAASPTSTSSPSSSARASRDGRRHRPPRRRHSAARPGPQTTDRPSLMTGRPNRRPATLDLAARALAERARRQASDVVGATRALIDPRRIAVNARLASQVVGSRPQRPARHRTDAPVHRDRSGRAERSRGTRFPWPTSSRSSRRAVPRSTTSCWRSPPERCVVTWRPSGSFDPGSREPRALIPIGSHDVQRELVAATASR